MEKLGKYELAEALTNQNAGYSLWGFGRKGGKDYFIKQFVEQKYPANDTVSSPERLAKKIEACKKFEQRKAAFYRVLNENSDGNAVRVEEFFRVESKYYIAMPKMNAIKMGVGDISKLPTGEIKRLCAIVAHSVAALHKGRMIHADLKPDNILFVKTAGGYTTAKIIDFDSGFLETDPPKGEEAIVGDFHYFSPEACMRIWGDEDVALTCKMDVFALGVLFHQYFTNELPGFNRTESSYSGEAVAKGEKLIVSDKLPKDVAMLLEKMLQADPDKRPAAWDVFCALRGLDPTAVPDKENKPKPVTTVPDRPAAGGSPFYRPGDL